MSAIDNARAALASYEAAVQDPQQDVAIVSQQDAPHLAAMLRDLVAEHERVEAARDEVQEKIAYLRRGCQVLTEAELRQKISAVGSAEWKLGYYWNALVQREQERAIRAQFAQRRAEDALRDIADHGLRFDLNPTLMITTADEVYTQWAAYARRIDESMRGRANEALAPTNHTDGSGM